MKDFLKTIFSAMKTWVRGNIKDSTADWNQNDPSAINYVKNRPFYEKEGIVYKLDKKYLPKECATLEQVEQVAEAIQAAVEDAQNIAYEAQDAAETAKSTAEAAQSATDSKMDKTNPTGTGSFSMNRKADTQIGNNSHAEGYSAQASGNGSHAEGYSTQASGSYSHVEGYQTIASGKYSHVEGRCNIADSVYKTVTKTLGDGERIGDRSCISYSTSFTFDNTTGLYTLTGEIKENPTASIREPMYYIYNDNTIQHYGTTMYYTDKALVTGYYLTNYSSNGLIYTSQFIDGKYVHIVGNGASNSYRSNAHTLDWDGNAWYQGEVYVGGTSQDDENAERLAKMSDIPSIEGLATESYVDSAMASLVNAAPDTLDTLNELAAALGDDANFATTVTSQMSSKLDASELPAAVNDALAQAKASGEFDGANGTNGTSATHSWSGTTLTITSASGTSSADLKGEKGDAGTKGDKGDKGDTGANGKDGHSPVRGTDYWTDADKAEIKSYVDEAILGGAW